MSRGIQPGPKLIPVPTQKKPATNKLRQKKYQSFNFTRTTSAAAVTTEAGNYFVCNSRMQYNAERENIKPQEET
jgi:hypothetical protein